MRSCFQSDATSRNHRKGLLHRFRCRCQFIFQEDSSGFIQNRVERPAISQIHANGELASFENLVCSPAHSASLLHSRSPFLCALSTIQHWERIASRRETGLLISSSTAVTAKAVYQALSEVWFLQS